MQYLVLVARMAEINYKVITAHSRDIGGRHMLFEL